MKPRVCLLCVALVALQAACSPAATASPPPPATATPAPIQRLETLRVELDPDAGLGGLPWVLALLDLEQQGYTVDRQAFADISVAVGALDSGDLEFSSSGNLSVWSAISQGAAVVTVIERASNNWAIIATEDIQSCADLDGVRIGVNSLEAVATTMYETYMERECPGVQPEVLVVPGSEARFSAMLAGEMDATVIPVEFSYQFERDAPGQYHALVYLAEEFPGLVISGFVTRRSLIEEYRETAKDVIRALLLVRRRLADPAVLQAEIQDKVELDADTAHELAATFIERDFWPVNGLLSHDMVQANLSFLQETAELSPELEAEDVADWSLLEEVLDEIGRQ